MGYWYHLGTTAGHGVFFRVWQSSSCIVFFLFLSVSDNPWFILAWHVLGAP